VELNQHDSVRISTLATFVVVAMRPVQSVPGAIVVSLVANARMRGGSFGAFGTAVGHGDGAAVRSIASSATHPRMMKGALRAVR
jgi:hypothetical protein